MNILKATGMAVIAASVLSGCSTLGVGDDEYACKGMPNGVLCKLPSEVYELTNSRDALHDRSALTADGKPAKGANKTPEEVAFPGRFIAPVSVPMPVLQPAQAMRVWIAPYVDAQNDLVMPSYLYTEVVSRKWSFGEKHGREMPMISPLQVDQRSMDESSDEGGSRPSTFSASPPLSQGQPQGKPNLVSTQGGGLSNFSTAP